MNWTEIAPQIILTIIASTMAAAPGIYAIWRGRNKEKADVAKAITEAAGELIEEYKDKLDRLEKIVEKQEKQIAKQEKQIACQDLKIEKQEEELQEAKKSIAALEVERDEVLAGVSALCTQIRELGHRPVWEPPA